MLLALTRRSRLTLVALRDRPRESPFSPDEELYTRRCLGFGGMFFPVMKTPLRQTLKSPPGTQEPTAILQGAFVLGRSQRGESHGDMDGSLVLVSSKSFVVAQICTVLPGEKASPVPSTPPQPTPGLSSIVSLTPQLGY